MSRSIIFLDVDGVLNSDNTINRSPCGFIGVEDQYIHRLRSIVKQTEAEVILVSDWKDSWSDDPKTCNKDGAYLNRRLNENGIFIHGKTDDSSRGKDEKSGRGLGIKKYLEANPDIEKYAILDDVVFSDYDEDLQEHLVHTFDGLTDDDAEKAASLLLHFFCENS